MIILGWVAGVLFIVIGAAFYAFNRIDEALASAEAELMLRGGLHDCEKELPKMEQQVLRNFRVTRALFDQEYAVRRAFIGKVIALIGVAFVAGLVIRGFITGAWFS